MNSSERWLLDFQVYYNLNNTLQVLSFYVHSQKSLKWIY